MFRGYFIRDIRNLWSGRVASYVVFALLLGLALSAQTSAKDTGYVFVSNAKMHSVAVIDPKQDYRVIAARACTRSNFGR